MASTTRNNGGPSDSLKPIPKKPKLPFTERLLIICAVLSGLLDALAIPELIGAENLLDYLKAYLIALSATGVAYGVNRLAVERGAPQAAIGMPMAGVVSVLSILIVGIGLFAATYAGLVRDASDILRLETYPQANAAYLDDQLRLARSSSQAETVVSSIVDDLAVKEQCEIDNGCISNPGNGGYGSTAQVIGSKLQQGEATLASLQQLQQTRDAIAVRLAEAQAAFQDVIGVDKLDGDERRRMLKSIAVAIGQDTSALLTANPSNLVAAYRDELLAGAQVPGNPRASANLSRVLQEHGRALASMDRLDTRTTNNLPVFPARTGVSDTLLLVLHFAPIAIIIFVVELVFPITLWCYVLFGHLGQIKRRDE